jgi:phospholipid-binding lipoprotein MlaA
MTDKSRARFCAIALALVLGGCATTQATVPEDPFERANRGTQRFNDAFDRTLLKPVASGYRGFVPGFMRTGISNLLSNLALPTTIVNDLLQLKLKDTAADIGRFVLNSTLGVGGLLDPATRVGIPRNDEDFGQTLGRWGMPAGPYVVLPLLGPSTLRDAPALAVDAQTDLRVQLDLDTEARVALGVISAVERRARFLAADEALDKAFDRYAFIRNAWLQRREFKVRDGDVPDEAPPEEDIEETGDYAPPVTNSATSLIPASAPSTAGGFL